MSCIMNAKELAEHLLVTPATIHNWHRRGLIPSLRASRRPILFDRDEVEAALRSKGESDCPASMTARLISAIQRKDHEIAEQIQRELLNRFGIRLQLASELIKPQGGDDE